jgi:prepilin signal peptidase PulO-like enzyme (type II secretory pathway)
MILLVLIVLGLCLGSFVNALVWRLHEQAKPDNKRNRPTQLSILHGRSMCPDCRHKLASIDLIPVVSWLMLKGKCRYCHKPISIQYPLVEILTVILFVISYYYWPYPLHGYSLAAFIVWLGVLTGFIALVVLDIRWYWLPDRIILPLSIMALVEVLLIALATHKLVSNLIGSLIGILIISGSFYLLYILSKGKWIGGGDVKLGFLIGMLVGGPLYSVLVLFLASTTGTISALPFFISGKIKRNSLLPFGPFLILATIITVLFGASIIHWYKNLYS